MMIATVTAVQYAAHGKQHELPKERLSPGLQVPQSNPEYLLAHCASAPLEYSD